MAWLLRKVAKSADMRFLFTRERSQVRNPPRPWLDLLYLSQLWPMPAVATKGRPGRNEPGTYSWTHSRAERPWACALLLILRNYLAMLGERDVFIAHAHQDKAEFVRPLVAALGRRAVSCWVDEAAIGPGDSLIDAMNEGLVAARYVVVPVTPRMLAAPWASRELNAALQMEVHRGETVVIPILAVSPSELDPYPLLLDKLWLDWSEGVDAIADKIAARSDRRVALDWHVDFPRSHVGPVWARVVATPETVGREHRLTLRWGPYIRQVRESRSSSKGECGCPRRRTSRSIAG
jgi:hypothetical protein